MFLNDHRARYNDAATVLDGHSAFYVAVGRPLFSVLRRVLNSSLLLHSIPGRRHDIVASKSSIIHTDIAYPHRWRLKARPRRPSMPSKVNILFAWWNCVLVKPSFKPKCHFCRPFASHGSGKLCKPRSKKLALGWSESSLGNFSRRRKYKASLSCFSASFDLARSFLHSLKLSCRQSDEKKMSLQSQQEHHNDSTFPLHRMLILVFLLLTVLFEILNTMTQKE